MSNTKRGSGAFNPDWLVAAFHALPDAILVLDGNGRVRLANAAATEFFGAVLTEWTLEDLAKTEPDFGLVPIGLPGDITNVRQTLKIHSERLSRDYLLTLVGYIQGYVVLLRDLTDAHDQEDFKHDMLRLATHDLRSPLALIISYCELMLLEIPEALPDLTQYVSIIHEAADRMKLLLDAVLHVERFRTVPLDLRRTVNPVDLIGAAVDNMRALAAQKNQQLLVALRPDLGLLTVDVLFIQEAMENLIGNAIKYTPEGGQITVRAYTGDERFQFVVEDTGIGIGAEHLPHVFEAFYRAKQPGTENIEGTGLGLSLVKAAVERHQGSVWVESSVGKGSRFGFWLPLQAEKE
ncbi:MAG: PAS domain-containing protein [Chloroflexi bacterium]|nr:PAS domain-containing protein [Chloroflexota bacterium]